MDVETFLRKIAQLAALIAEVEHMRNSHHNLREDWLDKKQALDDLAQERPRADRGGTSLKDPDDACEFARIRPHGPVVVVCPCGHGYCAECRDDGYASPCIRCMP